MNLSHILCVLATMLSFVLCYEKITISELDIDLGGKAGLSTTSSISNENLQKILAGVESGNKDNIYFYGLIKLYGISVTKDTASASANFLRASNLGHMEATTAYGVSLLTGMGVKQDYLAAAQFFRKAVAMGDLVRKNANITNVTLTLTSVAERSLAAGQVSAPIIEDHVACILG